MLLRNIDIKETFDKFCNCHTCFVKLPLVTAALVALVVLLSGCSPKVENGWRIMKDPNSYSVLFRPDGSMVSIIKSQ